MVAPTLTDYQYQFKDTGFLINAAVALPFIDVEKVQGLGQVEFPVFVDETDGQHGSSIYVGTSSGRMIVIDGTLYATPTAIETTLDTLATNFLPDNIEYPFYFKQPGVAQRYCLAKTLGIKYDEETLRRIGACTIQIQLGCPKPEKRVDNTAVTRTVNPFTNVSIPNTGSTPSYMKYTVVGAWSNMTFGFTTTGQTLQIVTSATVGDTCVIDFRTKTVFKNGINVTGQCTFTGTWWVVTVGSAGSASAVVNSGSVPTSVLYESYSAWL